VLTFQVDVPIVNHHRQYDFQLEARIGFFF
jgi:hypothetical protein